MNMEFPHPTREPLFTMKLRFPALLVVAAAGSASILIYAARSGQNHVSPTPATLNAKVDAAVDHGSCPVAGTGADACAVMNNGATGDHCVATLATASCPYLEAHGTEAMAKIGDAPATPAAMADMSCCAEEATKVKAVDKCCAEAPVAKE
jgi:hypothetical protein